MIYLALILTIFIAFAITYTVRIFLLVIDQKSKNYHLDASIPAPMIVEMAYRSKDYHASMRYVDEQFLMSSNFYVKNFETVIGSEEHKKHVIHNMLHGITEKLLEDKVVEIRENDGDFRSMYPEKEINLRLKVYVPE